MFILRKNWLKYRKNKYYFHNYIFRKFEIVCFAALLHGVERNTFLNFDSVNDSLKSKTWNSWKRMHCNEESRRTRGNGTSRSRMQEWQGRKKWQRAPSDTSRWESESETSARTVAFSVYTPTSSWAMVVECILFP